MTTAADRVHDGADLGNPAWWDRPYEERAAGFAALRATRPISRHVLPGLPEAGVPDTEFWALTRHADVVEASRHPELFCSGRGILIADLPPDLDDLLGAMINMDDPRHARLRRIVSRAFTPRSLEALMAGIDATAAGIVDGIAGQGSCDLVTDLAAILPIRVILDLVGVPRSEEQFVFDRTNILIGSTDDEYVEGAADPAAAAAAMFQAGQDLAGLMRELADERIRAPRDDLATALVTSQVDGEHLTPEEMASFFILLVTAGNETTRNAIAHGVRLLCEHPDQRDRWLADFEGLAPTAVDEIVRVASPVMHFRRTVTRDGVRLGDHEFAEGDRVVLWYWAANRDEAVFEDPERFDIGRTPNDHVGFGGPGPHYCLGAHLARREITVMFRHLLRRLPDIQVVGEPERLYSNFVNGIKHMPVEFTPA